MIAQKGSEALGALNITSIERYGNSMRAQLSTMAQLQFAPQEYWFGKEVTPDTYILQVPFLLQSWKDEAKANENHQYIMLGRKGQTWSVLGSAPSKGQLPTPERGTWDEVGYIRRPKLHKPHAWA